MTPAGPACGWSGATRTASASPPVELLALRRQMKVPTGSPASRRVATSRVTAKPATTQGLRRFQSAARWLWRNERQAR